MRTFLRRVEGDSAEADDLAQETFLTAFARLAAFKGESSLKVWICGIAYHKARTARRGLLRRRVRELHSQTADPHVDPRGHSETRLDIQAAFLRLTVEQRAAAALCLTSDMSHSEAAAALGLPLGTLKSRVASARKVLMAELEAYR